MEHIFGDVHEQLKDLKIRDRYKIVGSYKEGPYEEIDITGSKEEAIIKMEGLRKKYGQDWTVIFYKID
tara:strand:+ start:686 stop:889 length:204 start_codon:yes stop_codon:yes gene_type:complete